MIRLVPMNEEAFKAFMKISMDDHIQSQIKSGYWRAENAKENMDKLRGQILPNDLATPNHFFFVVEDVISGKQVGGLWYLVMEEEGKRQVFVVDIQIYEPYRRQGFGTETFLAMEKQAQEMGITTISLNVFQHNTSARAMYEKLGYVGLGETMIKNISLEENE